MDPSYTAPYSGTAVLWVNGGGYDMGAWVVGVGNVVLPLAVMAAVCMGLWLSLKVLP